MPRQTSSAATEADGKPLRGAAVAAGCVFGARYRLEERLGEGGLGVVWRVRHLGLQRDFALKLLRASGPHGPDALARFQREAEALGRLRHPNVVDVTDFGVDGATEIPYLVMELLPGRTLADFLRDEGPLQVSRALPLLEALAGAIDAAHEKGILHRDLKPGNVAFTADGAGTPLVKVLDFGLADIADPSATEESPDAAVAQGIVGGDCLTGTGALLGTPLYVAPETILRAAAGRASDIYSLGVIAYEMLAGRPPFQGRTADVLASHLERDPPQPSPLGELLPEETWEALQEPLRKDPALRPASAREVVDKIRRAAERAALARWRAVEIPRRAWISALLSAILLLAALLPWPELPAERWVRDLRLRAVPLHRPDPRILLVTMDEASLGEQKTSLADRADEVGSTLARVFAAGPCGVAIDLLLPAQWGDSPAFSDLVVRNPETLTLAASSGLDGQVIGTECVSELTAAALGPDRTAGLFGFVNLDDDPDGVIRRARLGYHDRSGMVRPSWAAKAAASLGTTGTRPSEATGTFWIDHRIAWPQFERISWRDVPAALDRAPRLFHDRLVLLGGDLRASGDDYHRVPHGSEGTEAVSSLILQALLVDTIAAGLPVREPRQEPIRAAAAVLTGLAMTGILCARRPSLFAGSLAAAAPFYVALSFPVFGRTGWMLSVSSPLLLALLGVVLALAVRQMLPQAPKVSS